MVSIDQKIVEIIQKNLESAKGWPWGNLLLTVIALVLSVFLCGMVGFEREKRGRSAGLRTHLLVGVGSCVIMIISIYGFPGEFANHRDVARLAAGVLAGVGFLGAGAIIHNEGSIKGLTTAGTIWLVMAIGLACGSFNFILAILVTAIVMCVLTTFRKIETQVNKRSPIINLITKTDVPVVAIVLEYARKNKLMVLDISSELEHNEDNEVLSTRFKLLSEINADVDLEKVEEELKKLTKAISIQRLKQH